MRPALVCMIAFGLPACTSEPPTTTAAAPIIGGTAAPDDDAVVLLVSFPPDRSVMATCSATLVAADVLLTAAHCVDAANHPGWLFGAFFGDSAEQYDTLAELEPQLAAVTEVHALPDYDPDAPFYGDIGVAILAAAVTDVASIPYGREPLDAAVVGAPARIVGYGQATVGVYSSTRRQAATVVAAIDAGDTIAVGDADHVTCLGDSGGPALYDAGAGEIVIGVDSYADNGSCDQPAHFRRPDLFLDFIDQYTGYVEPGEPDADPGSGGDDDGGDDDGGGGGGCTTTGSGGGAGLVLVLAALARARQRFFLTENR